MDFGDVHFIILDLLWGAEEYDDNQKNWLISQLESIPQEEKVIVLTHAFFVSSGYVDKAYNRNWYDNPLMIEKLCPVFEKYKVDLVISGHNHLMELLEKDGVTLDGQKSAITESSEFTVNNELYVFKCSTDDSRYFIGRVALFKTYDENNSLILNQKLHSNKIMNKIK